MKRAHVAREEIQEYKPLEQTVPASILVAEVQAWSKRIGIKPLEIQVRPMKHKWASCSSRGRLTFDAALLRQPARFRARIIVHELLHLKLPNHGKLFQSLLTAYLDSVPDHREPGDRP